MAAKRKTKAAKEKAANVETAPEEVDQVDPTAEDLITEEDIGVEDATEIPVPATKPAKRKLVSTDGTTDVPNKGMIHVPVDPDAGHSNRTWFRVSRTSWSPSPSHTPLDEMVHYGRGELVYLTREEADWAFTHRVIARARPSPESIEEALPKQAHIPGEEPWPRI